MTVTLTRTDGSGSDVIALNVYLKALQDTVFNGNIGIVKSIPGVSAFPTGDSLVINNINYVAHSAVFSSPNTGGDIINQGIDDINVLRVASNVADAETVTIGANVYEVTQVNSASGDTTLNGSWNNTTALLTVDITLADYPNLYSKFVVGNIISIGSEILKVKYINGTQTSFVRGDSGTTNATHANGVAIKIGNGYTAGNIPVGLIATLTPAAFSPALVAQINSYGTENFSANMIVASSEVLIYSKTLAKSCTETLAGANNAWVSATTYGGKASTVQTVSVQSRVPLAGEVTLGTMHFTFPFAATFLSVYIAPTATPGIAKAWDGVVSSVTIGSSTVITIDNSGATNWAATDTVVLTVLG